MPGISVSPLLHDFPCRRGQMVGRRLVTVALLHLCLIFGVPGYGQSQDEDFVNIFISKQNNLVVMRFSKEILSVDYWDTEFSSNYFIVLRLRFPTKTSKEMQYKVLKNTGRKLESAKYKFISEVKINPGKTSISIFLKKGFVFQKMNRPKPKSEYYRSAFFEIKKWNGKRVKSKSETYAKNLSNLDRKTEVRPAPPLRKPVSVDEAGGDVIAPREEVLKPEPIETESRVRDRKAEVMPTISKSVPVDEARMVFGKKAKAVMTENDEDLRVRLEKEIRAPYRGLYNLEVTSEVRLVRKPWRVLVNGDNLRRLPPPLKPLLHNLGPENFEKLSQKDADLLRQLSPYLIDGYSLEANGDTITITLTPGQIRFSLDPGRKSDSDKMAFRQLPAELGLMGKLILQENDTEFVLSGPLSKRFFINDTPGFIIKKKADRRFSVRPTTIAAHLNISFFSQRFGEEKRQVFMPADLVIRDENGAALKLTSTAGSKNYKQTLFARHPEKLMDQLRDYKGSNRNFTVRCRSIERDENTFHVGFNLYDKAERVLLIYYPLQAKSSYRSTILTKRGRGKTEARVQAAFRFLDSQLVDLIQVLERREIYDAIYIRFAKSQDKLVEVTTDLNRIHSLLYRKSGHYKSSEYHWDYSSWEVDLQQTTSAMDILSFDALETTKAVKKRYGDLSNRARVCLLNFISTIGGRIERVPINVNTMIYKQISIDDFLGDKEILTMDRLADFF